MYFDLLNSLRPSDAYMPQQTKSPLIQIMAGRQAIIRTNNDILSTGPYWE